MRCHVWHIETDPAPHAGGQLVPNAAAEQCVDDQIRAHPVVQFGDVDATPGGSIPGTSRHRSLRVGERMDRDETTAIGEPSGSHPTVATVVAGPCQNRDAASVSGSEIDRGAGERPAGTLHELVDPVAGLSIETSRFSGGENGLHLLEMLGGTPGARMVSPRRD